MAEAWGLLTKYGLAPNASMDRLEFASSMQEALREADFVQENGPERRTSRSSCLLTWMMPRTGFYHRFQLFRSHHGRDSIGVQTAGNVA